MKHGTIAFYNASRGFGVIIAQTEGTEYIFYSEQSIDKRDPRQGDTVHFEPSFTKDGSAQALKVTIAENPGFTDAVVPGPNRSPRSSEKGIGKEIHRNPYYGKPAYAYKTEGSHSRPSKTYSANQLSMGGAIVGATISYFLLDGGWLLNLFVALVFFILYHIIFRSRFNWLIMPISSSRATASAQVESFERKITSTCLKCGGIGEVTAQDGGYFGFQCPRCGAFWKKRVNNVLSSDEVYIPD
jgi:cold shock CspA family protein/predicted RNA-binding Zn-ribbon protein involved in translation (DUF1610 family)